jgi:polysaccharide export outer membrane protein
MTRVLLMAVLCTIRGLQTSSAAQAPAVEAASPARSGVENEYKLGSGDQITISAVGMDEISKAPYRLDSAGYISVAFLGNIKSAGLSVAELEAEITSRLKEFQLSPRVSVGIHEFKSQPVSVIGAVATPGVHYLEGNRTLVEALSAAGGLRQDAGNTVKISRRVAQGQIPLQNAVLDASGEVSVAEVKIATIMDASHPTDNIFVKSHDVISVPKAALVYVIGEVERSGGFPLTEHESMSVLEAVSLAGGLKQMALARRAKILRFRSGASERREETVDLRRIMDGRDEDVALRPDDILYLATNKSKAVTMRTVEALVGAGTGIAVWRASK